MKFDDIKEGVNSLWESVADGWRHLQRSAANALTRFRPTDKSSLPAREEIDDPLYLPVSSWAMLGGEVFEDEKRVVVRVEVPGMDKQDLDIQVRDDALVITGEKRFEREETQGRWRVMQRAYGSFRRVVPIATPVVTTDAKATYRNGVLRVELPKATPGQPRSVSITVE